MNYGTRTITRNQASGEETSFSKKDFSSKYRSLACMYHPDKRHDNDQWSATKDMHSLTSAMEVINNYFDGSLQIQSNSEKKAKKAIILFQWKLNHPRDEEGLRRMHEKLYGASDSASSSSASASASSSSAGARTHVPPRWVDLNPKPVDASVPRNWWSTRKGEELILLLQNARYIVDHMYDTIRMFHTLDIPRKVTSKAVDQVLYVWLQSNTYIRRMCGKNGAQVFTYNFLEDVEFIRKVEVTASARFVEYHEAIDRMADAPEANDQ